MDYQDFLETRRAEILERVNGALESVGRSAESCLVEAVSKTVECDVLPMAAKAGWTVFAENRPQELVRKYATLEEAGLLNTTRIDMIGNLQTNKINQILGRAALIHSISSLHLAQAVAKRAVARETPTDVLLEVNVSGELSKSGFTPQEIRTSFEEILALEGIRVCGLMTMAPIGSKDVARRVFSDLRDLRDELSAAFGVSLPELSCGMSDDFVEAAQEGSTILRLGRVVFDPNYDLE